MFVSKGAEELRILIVFLTVVFKIRTTDLKKISYSPRSEGFAVIIAVFNYLAHFGVDNPLMIF